MNETPVPHGLAADVSDVPDGLDARIDRWRAGLLERPGVDATDVDELEDHLRGHLDALTRVGLTEDEALLVAIQRVGRQDAIAAGLAREHAGRLWRQHVPDAAPDEPRTGLVGMLVFAVLAGLAVKVPAGFLMEGGVDQVVLGRAATATILCGAAILAGYLAWRSRRPAPAALVGFGVLLAVLAGVLLGYPFVPPFSTQLLSLLHAPIVIAVALGVAYLGRDWRQLDRWMDYLRFLGELAIYYVLIALGGGVLLGLGAASFFAVGVDPEPLFEWVLPLGVGGAVVVAAWLVESKQSVVENMAPVLSLVFTPLFTLLLVSFLGVLAVSGPIAEADRSPLIIIDLVLVVVLALHVFSVSARPAGTPPGWFDRLQLLLLVVAIAVDVVVLVAMAGRIAEYGSSPNKVAALGENLVLLVNLVWAAGLSIGFLRGRRPFADLERWQCRYLPVIGVWALVVVAILPPVFAFG
ncbi:MAG: hypothetical protein Q4F65_10270 [Propionibacteriaceae bacterium]|nr:hypothetical protein [Propionibacteriaceae bacterium]